MKNPKEMRTRGSRPITPVRLGCAVDPSGHEVGCDPRSIGIAALHAIGHRRQPVLKTIRHKCLDCCAGNKGEVAKCVSTTCPLWPYRKGTNPFRKPRTRAQVHASKRQGAKLLSGGREGA